MGELRLADNLAYGYVAMAGVIFGHGRLAAGEVVGGYAGWT